MQLPGLKYLHFPTFINAFELPPVLKTQSVCHNFIKVYINLGLSMDQLINLLVSYSKTLNLH
jgi:hypothetical protein